VSLLQIFFFTALADPLGARIVSPSRCLRYSGFGHDGGMRSAARDRPGAVRIDGDANVRYFEDLRGTGGQSVEE